MADEVPPIDSDPDQGNDELSTEQIRITNQLLAAEATAREGANREVDQRYFLRWAAFAISVLIIAGMGTLLWHVSHKLMSLNTFGASTTYIIAVYVAPIVSMTTLSIALLVAAFRKFRDGDEETGLGAATNGARSSGLLN